MSKFEFDYLRLELVDEEKEFEFQMELEKVLKKYATNDFEYKYSIVEEFEQYE